MICRLASPDSALPELTGDERVTTDGVSLGESKEESTVRVFDGGGGPPTFWLTRLNGDMQELTYPPTASSPQSQRTVIVSESQSQTESDERRDFWATSRVNGDTQSPAAGGDAEVRVKEEGGRGSGGTPGPVNNSPPTLWLTPGATPGCRINGVMPELIGGGLNYSESLKPPVSSPHRSGAVRAAPTVIMGEAGGVRTMIWSQPSADPPQSTPGPASSTWSNSEESAAQLLLNLGQARAPALNMERLWAGDLSQLPASHQALNLSWPPAPWLRNGEPTRQEEADDEDQPMVCMICEDKATGLHYGIITCEG